METKTKKKGVMALIGAALLGGVKLIPVAAVSFTGGAVRAYTAPIDDITDAKGVMYGIAYHGNCAQLPTDMINELLSEQKRLTEAVRTPATNDVTNWVATDKADFCAQLKPNVEAYISKHFPQGAQNG
jgi:hypothetical protein